ncbi:MAG: M56 family metallopeptidase [Lawsonibacter sp.]|nr:M56 family metallopeptidase [Lawsonibacter sp.]
MRDFLRLLFSVSLSGGLLTVLTACLNRLLRGRVPKGLLYYLWLFALLRFLCPVGTPWSLSHQLAARPLLPQAQSIVRPAEPAPREELPAVSGQSPAPEPPPGVHQEKHLPQYPLRRARSETDTSILLIWAAGLFAVLGWQLTGYTALNRNLRLRESAVLPWEEELLHTLILGNRRQPRLRRSSAAPAPMLTGLFTPTVWLPMEEADRTALGFALRHELVHWRRRDLLYKWALAAAAAVHWFNPAVWYLLRTVERDCELSCDERATQGLSPGERTGYGEMLLQAAARQSCAGGGVLAPLWSQKENLKERLHNIMKPTRLTRRAKRLFAAAVLTVAVTSAALGAYAIQSREGVQTGSPPLPSPAELETSLDLTVLKTLGMTAESAVEARGAGLVIAHRETGEQVLLLTWNGGQAWEELIPPRPEYDAFGELYAAPEHWGNSTLRVLADLPEEDITLYGFYQKEYTNQGPWCLLRRGDHWDQFSQVTFCPGPQIRLSDMSLADYDGDGVPELAVSNCIGTGTGVNAFQLYLFEENEAGGFTLSASLTEQSLCEQVAAAVWGSYDPDRFIYTIETAGDSWQCDLSGDSDWLTDAPIGEPLAPSEYFQYTLVPLRTTILLMPEQMPMYSIASYTAALRYDGSSLALIPESGWLEELPGCPLTRIS